jgi:hypothetical protein
MIPRQIAANPSIAGDSSTILAACIGIGKMAMIVGRARILLHLLYGIVVESVQISTKSYLVIP